MNGETMESIQVGRLFSVEGLIAVVTGGTEGIGQMIVKSLAANGAERIYVVGDSEKKLKEITEFNPDVIIPKCADITSQEDLGKLAEEVESEIGFINLLVTGESVLGPSVEKLKKNYTLDDFVQLAWKTPMAEFTDTYVRNCTAMYYTVVAFLKLLDEGNKRGNYIRSQVIALASSASFLRKPGAGFAYMSSKAADISLVKSLSSYCIPWAIRVNALAAGLFPEVYGRDQLFRMLVQDRSKTLTEEGVFSKDYQPAERGGSIEDIAGTVLYMASRAGEFVNGSVCLVDGGKVAALPATY